MVLSSEWSQVEVIDLINDGTNLSGLGFILVGGRSTGVSVIITITFIIIIYHAICKSLDFLLLY